MVSLQEGSQMLADAGDLQAGTKIPYFRRIATVYSGTILVLVGLYLATAMLIVLAISQSIWVAVLPSLAVVGLSLVATAAMIRIVNGRLWQRPFWLVVISSVSVVALTLAAELITGEVSGFFVVVALLLGVPGATMLVTLFWTNPPLPRESPKE